jgi:transcriptional regulator with XRE-family HTH domain
MRNSSDHRGFGRRLRATRIALGLTEEQAAAAAGRTVETWRKYEATGTGYCTGPLLLFCQRYPDVSLDWLFCGRVLSEIEAIEGSAS